MAGRKKLQKGFSLVEVMIASAILSGVVVGAMTMQNITFNRTIANNDKAFATQKAMQMFEELRAYVQANRETDIAKLQNFSDGSSYNHILTTEKREISGGTGNIALDLTNPADPLSGNQKIPGTNKWKFLRQIQVKPVANDDNARYVSVAVFYADPQNNNIPKGNAERPLAVISGVLKTNISQDPPTQMYDLFVIAIENSPSWWVDMADLRPSFERTLIDLEQRNPGLIFKRHFITRNGFGRDPYYMPYINDGGNANAQDLPWVYLYPGNVNNALTVNYVLDNMRGRVRTDTADGLRPLDKQHSNYGSTTPYRHYALADQFNHVLRFPEQRAMEERLKEEDPETYGDSPSLVTFLEDLNKGDVYRNALVINLHGELLPLPAIRNYSDPAKAPDKHARTLTGNPNAPVPGDNTDTNNSDFISLRNKRVVSHPENLRYNNGETVSWRVYAFEDYASDNSVAAGGLSLDNTVERDRNSIPKITLFIPTIGKGPHYNGSGNGFLQNYPDFSPTAVTGLTIERMVGGRVTNTGSPSFQPYEWWKPSSSGFKAITNTHDPSQAQARIVRAAGNSITHVNGTPIASLSYPVNVQSLTFSSAIGSSVAERNALRGMLVVLGYGTPNQRVARIRDISGPSNNIINFTTPFQLSNATALSNINSVAITRHKDYDAEVIDATLYGHPHKGILITLYDTPTRHNCQNDTNCSSGGLDSNDRLDGLEYIPAPLNGSTAAAFSNRDLSNTSNEMKNTARWRISLDTSSYAMNFSNRMLTLETRIVTASDTTTPVISGGDGDGNGIYDPCEAPGTSGSPLSGTDQSERETRGSLCQGLWGDGDPYVPNNPNTPSVNEHQTILRPHLYNVSRTYTYLNHYFTDAQGTTLPGGSVTSNIPSGTLVISRTEQAQFMGHPFYNPYLDVKSLHRYNRHFANVSAASNGYSGFDRATGTNWNTDNIDLNWYFQLYTTGIMRSNAVYNSISGYSNYYYAFGGEIGTDGTNAIFDIRTQPWSEADTGTSTVNNTSATVREIINDSGGGERVIFSTDASTAGGANERWRMRQYLGQLFPDFEIGFWRNNGNLPSRDYNHSSHNLVTGGPPPRLTYFRGLSNSNPRALGYQTHRRISTQGAPYFMNANTATNPSGSNLGLDHIFTSGQGILTNSTSTDAGAQLMSAFNLTLSDQIPSNRPFRLDQTTLGSSYASLEIAAIRNRARYINTTTGVISTTPNTGNVYYRHSTDLNNRVSSAFIRLTRPNPMAPVDDLNGIAGYFLVNGFENTAGTGTQEIARLSQAASLQTYMDAGDRSIPGTASGRTVQLPRVKISEPRSSQVYENPTTIGVDLNVAWLRWDDKKYSPAYPNNWYDSTRLLYNIKYSTDNKRTWKYADDGSDVPSSYLYTFNPSHSVMGGPESSPAGSWNKSYSWNVSGLPEGNYVLRVEVYREGFNTGYSYHDVFVTIER